MSSFRPLALLVVAALSACTAAAHEPAPVGRAVPGDQAPPIGSGEIVTALDPQMGIVFQAQDGAHWFGSNGRGVYRFDGRTIVRFTKEHGLGGDAVRSIQEDRSGNVYVCSADGVVSRFDGRAFSTLRVADPSKSEWKLEPDDLWFPGGQDSGVVYRWDGTSLHRLAFPKTQAGDAATLPRDKFPNAKYSPYDVYTSTRDSRGHVWFGTSNLGACRYDGTSFAWVDRTDLDFDEGDAGFGVRSIIEVRDGGFWLSNTLNRFDVLPPSATAPAERGTVALRYRKQPGPGAPSDPYSLFMSAVRDRNGDLLLATLGAGVWRYDGARWTHYPVRHGGSDIWVCSIYRDRQDALWLGTQEHGVYKFDGETFEPFKP